MYKLAILLSLTFFMATAADNLPLTTQPLTQVADTTFQGDVSILAQITEQTAKSYQSRGLNFFSLSKTEQSEVIQTMLQTLKNGSKAIEGIVTELYRDNDRFSKAFDEVRNTMYHPQLKNAFENMGNFLIFHYQETETPNPLTDSLQESDARFIIDIFSRIDKLGDFLRFRPSIQAVLLRSKLKNVFDTLKQKRHQTDDEQQTLRIFERLNVPYYLAKVLFKSFQVSITPVKTRTISQKICFDISELLIMSIQHQEDIRRYANQLHMDDTKIVEKIMTDFFEEVDDDALHLRTEAKLLKLQEIITQRLKTSPEALARLSQPAYLALTLATMSSPTQEAVQPVKEKTLVEQTCLKMAQYLISLNQDKPLQGVNYDEIDNTLHARDAEHTCDALQRIIAHYQERFFTVTVSSQIQVLQDMFTNALNRHQAMPTRTQDEQNSLETLQRLSGPMYLGHILLAISESE